MRNTRSPTIEQARSRINALEIAFAMRIFWRTLKLSGLGLLGIVGIGLIWLAVAKAAAEGRVEEKLAELRAAGQPTSLADLARKPIPPESNAATYLRRAADDLAAIEKEVEGALDAATAREQEDFAYRHHATPAVQKAMQAAFASHPNAIPLLEKAAECPHYDPQLDYSKAPQQFLKEYLESSQDVRRPIRVLDYRVVMLLMDEQREEAFQTCLTMLRLARHFDPRPLVINFLVTLAVRGVTIAATDDVLRSGPLPLACYDSLNAELARHDLGHARQAALRSERAFGIQKFREDSALRAYLKSPSGMDDQASYLDFMEEAIQMAGRPYFDRQARAKTKVILVRAGPLTKSVAPALEAESVALARTQAGLRALAVLSAILVREQAGKTDEPKLSNLGLPAEVTTDPFNGKPLIVKKTPEGWLIYSVGMNLQDDGGKVDSELNDVGLGPVPAAGME
jgi:hypothetical protein